MSNISLPTLDSEYYGMYWWSAWGTQPKPGLYWYRTLSVINSVSRSKVYTMPSLRTNKGVLQLCVCLFSSQEEEMEPVTPVTFGLCILLTRPGYCEFLSALIIHEFTHNTGSTLFLSLIWPILCPIHTLVCQRPLSDNQWHNSTIWFWPHTYHSGTTPCSHCFRDPVSLLPTTVFPVH